MSTGTVQALSLPPKNESLAEQVNSSKEKNDDRQGKAGTV
ncbi:hypothetical protein P3T22_006560, partial [Paraburkholderia sp. GAS348]